MFYLLQIDKKNVKWHFKMDRGMLLFTLPVFPIYSTSNTFFQCFAFQLTTIALQPYVTQEKG